MPHNQLRLQGGVIENETPVVNQAGIAVSNRIRFMPDTQGLSLPQKLGGWAKFFASTIAAGVVRALWGWQDTNNNQWIGLGADNNTTSGLEVIQCTINGATGLTSATGTLTNITPKMITDVWFIQIQTATGSNLYNLFAPVIVPAITVPPTTLSVYITNPISVGGVVLQGLYNVGLTSVPLGNIIQIVGTDVLGNPLNAQYTTFVSQSISGVTFASGTPNTLTITFSPGSVNPPGQNVNISVADNSITGSYIVLSSTATTVTVATTLSSYTFATTGTINNAGVVPIYRTTASSTLITCTFPNHGQSVGNVWTILNPTLVGGITLQGQYTVLSVPNSYTFTFIAQSAATATSLQYQGAISTITAGVSTGTNNTLVYTPVTGNGGWPADIDIPIFVQGVSPAGFNGYSQTISGGAAGRLVYEPTASGVWVSGGSFSPVGGLTWNIYTTNNASGVTTSPLESAFWTLDSWGNDLVACSGNTPGIVYPTYTIPYQPIYYWDATSGAATASIMTFGPPASRGAFVAMPQRQVVAWGTSFPGEMLDPLLIRWCDINNFNTWVDQVTNQAASFRLPSGAAIIGARQVFQQGLIWTDIELWSMTYINQPYIYSFNKIGQGCGLIGKYAHGVLGGAVYWMGKSQFFTTSGEGVQPIPCPIWDVAFQDLDLINVGKITCATNAMFNEVTWYFPIKSGTGENSNYVKYNTVAGVWDFGVLDRSAWIDVSVLQQPIGFSPANSVIYQHEISPDADGAAMGESFTTGWFALAEGDVMPYVDQIWPDMKWGYYNQTQNASVQISASAQAYPGATQYGYGPYTVTQSTTYISPRIRNRLVNFTVSGTGTGTWWRLGGIRYRVQQDGKF